MKKSKSPNFVTTKPFGNYFRKYKSHFVWLNIFQIINFFNFPLREAFKPPKNVLDTLASWMEMATNTMTFLIRCYNFKRFKSEFWIFFLNQYYSNHQFSHFSTAKIPSWYMAFIINLWNKILGQFKQRVFTTENIYSTRVIYDLWTCSCIDEYKPELRQHLKLWRKFAPFPPV